MNLLLCALMATSPWICPQHVPATDEETLETDLLIVGATESGWAAAIQAARMGVPSITVVHDGEWVGGQFTEQALACVDENKGPGKVGWGVDWHPMKRSFHRSGLFRELMDRIEAFNLAQYGDTMPGRPYHGPSTFRPVEAERIFREMLRPYMARGQIRLILRHVPTSVDVEGTLPVPLVTGDGRGTPRQPGAVDDPPRVTGVTFQSLEPDRTQLRVQARIVVDASDWGDVIQLSGAAWECGPDPQHMYGEPSAPVDLKGLPHNEMNPITWAMIVEQSTEPTPIPRPDRYDDRCFVRTTHLSREGLGRLDWDRPVRPGSIPHWPDAGQESSRQLSVLTVRRLVDGSSDAGQPTLVLLNYMLGQDYPLERLPRHVVEALEATEPFASQKNIVEMSREQRQTVFDDAKRHALCVLYHLQNYVHERAPDTTNSFRNYHLSREFNTSDHLPPKPYIRESLRLKALYMMREQDARNADGPTKEHADDRFARVLYPDGVCCWQFHYDFHRTGRAYLKSEGDAGPWVDFEKPNRHTHFLSDRSVFPARSLVPVSMDGLLGAQKNLGYSSIVCAAIRLHDQCIAIGQAAGAMAAVAIRHDVPVQDLPNQRVLLEEVRGGLCSDDGDGLPLLLFPFRDLPADHPAFVAVNRLAAMGMVPVAGTDVDFLPDAEADEQWKATLIAAADEQLAEGVSIRTATAGLVGPAAQHLSRGEFCQQLWTAVSEQQLRPWKSLQNGDADRDGIADLEDPTPFHAAPLVQWKLENDSIAD